MTDNAYIEGFNVKDFEEGVTDMALNATVKKIFEQIGVSSDIENGEWTQDIFLKVVKTETKEQLEKTLDLIREVVENGPDTEKIKKDDNERSNAAKVRDKSSVNVNKYDKL